MWRTDERNRTGGAHGKLPLSFVAGRPSIFSNDSNLRSRRQFLFVPTESFVSQYAQM